MKFITLTIAAILHGSATFAAWIAAPFVAFLRSFNAVKLSAHGRR